jgi:hypothetical protein
MPQEKGVGVLRPQRLRRGKNRVRGRFNDVKQQLGASD